MSATQDYVALDWIKGEITQTLERAQYALEAVAEAPEDKSHLRLCLTAIHEAHGTLKMVDLEGPTQVAAEMEALAQALMNGASPDKARAQEILMQVILQMPNYLERIQRDLLISGKRRSFLTNLEKTSLRKCLNLSNISSLASIDHNNDR